MRWSPKPLREAPARVHAHPRSGLANPSSGGERLHGISPSARSASASARALRWGDHGTMAPNGKSGRFTLRRQGGSISSDALDDRMGRTKESLQEAQIKKAGSLKFPNTDRPPAKFARLPSDLDKEQVNIATDTLLRAWKLQSPKVLISVTGGAKYLNLDKRLVAVKKFHERTARGVEQNLLLLVHGREMHLHPRRLHKTIHLH